MDEKKQLEELAKDVCSAITQCHLYTKGHCKDCKYTNEKFDICKYLLIADELAKLGYRKIPKGMIVIDENENPCLSCPVPEDIQRDVDCSTICGAVRLGIDWKNQCRVLVKENKQLTKALAETRKETAREILQAIKSALDEYRLDNEYFIEGEPNGNLWQMNASIFYLEVIDDGGLIDQIARQYGLEVE